MHAKFCNVLRLLSLLVTALLTWIVFNNERIFYYDSMWSRIMSRSEVTSQFANCLKALVLIAFFGAMFLLIKSYFSRFYVESIILDRFANLAVVLSIILDIVLTKFLYRGNVLFEASSTKWFLIFSFVMLFLTVTHFIVSNRFMKVLKADDSSEDPVMESNRNRRIRIAKLLCIICTLAIMIPVVISLVSYMKFLPNYGIMGKQQLSYSEEMMNDYMDFYYDGVFVGDDLYYLSSDYREIYVYHTATKESEIFWSGSDFMYCITSDNSYLYVSGFRTNSDENSYAELIKRINIETGQCEELLATDELYIQGIAIRDGILYYYAKERGGNRNTIYCIDISENMNFANVKVYADCLSDIYLSFEPDTTLYLAYVAGYSEIFYEGHLETQCGIGVYITKNGEYFYNIICDGYDNSGKDKISYYPGKLMRYRESDDLQVIQENIIAENVSAYGWGNNHLYYAVTTSEGFEIYESNPDGSNSRCIASGQNGMHVCALYTAENYIVYSYGNYYLNEAEEGIMEMDSVSIGGLSL